MRTTTKTAIKRIDKTRILCRSEKSRRRSPRYTASLWIAVAAVSFIRWLIGESSSEVQRLTRNKEESLNIYWKSHLVSTLCKIVLHEMFPNLKLYCKQIIFLKMLPSFFSISRRSPQKRKEKNYSFKGWSLVLSILYSLFK